MAGLLIAVAALLLAVYLYLKRSCRYWRRVANIDGPQPSWVLGNISQQITGRKHFGEIFADVYRSYPQASWVGVYELFNKPAVLVRDLELVKEILVSSFQHFNKNSFEVDASIDPLASMNPFVNVGDQWKEKRSQIVPVLTATRVRSTFPIIKNVAENFLNYVDRVRGGSPDFEVKEVCGRYTIDSVASCAFGIDAESFANPDAEFARMGFELFNADSAIAWLRAMLALFAPKLASLLKLAFIPKHIDCWFRSLIENVTNLRKDGKVQRRDLFQAIHDTLSQNGTVPVNSNELIGHSVTFLTEGFETSGTLMSYVLFELATNREVQDRVLQELDSALEDDQLTDEAVQKLVYLERAMYETLRLHAATLTLTKVCTKEYELPAQYPTDRKRVRIQPGTAVIIPVYGIHYDPEIFPDPHRFEPDRFLEENKKTRHRYAFLGFGEGPRICLGMKFGLLQSKIGIATLLSKYRVELSPKQQLPLEVSKSTWLLAPKGGIWVRFVERKK